MAIVTLTPVAVTVQGWQLVTRDDMFTALKWLTDNGYSGHVNGSYVNPATQWSLSFAENAGNVGSTYTAYIGDWVTVKNGAVAEVVTAAVKSSLYQ